MKVVLASPAQSGNGPPAEGIEDKAEESHRILVRVALEKEVKVRTTSLIHHRIRGDLQEGQQRMGLLGVVGDGTEDYLHTGSAQTSGGLYPVSCRGLHNV